VKKALIASVVLVGIAILLSAAGIATFIWSAGRSLEQREAWVEAELRIRSARAAALQDLDWPPYGEFLKTLRSIGSKSAYGEILDWRVAGCPMDEWSATIDPGFKNRHWPVFAPPAPADVPAFLQSAPAAQDIYRGGGLGSSFFRAGEERDLMIGWHSLLEQGLLSPAELEESVGLLGRLDASRPLLKDELEVEHLLRCRDFLRIYRTSKDPERLLPSQQPGWRTLYSRALLFSQLLNELERLHQRELTLGSQSPQEIWRWIEPGTTPQPSVNVRFYEGIDRDIFWREGHALQRRQLLRTALAIARFGAAMGRHPDRLEDLVPKYLPAVPRSPLTDAPLAYAGGTVAADVQDDLQRWKVKVPGKTR
jgi:hypothetical protein